ncbi:GNAT family N-acetyltransferase [Pulveribacter suum]|uniref:N-acetyltransferase n=1 Tax=Pulveribacter suum TaxID=2116657 RepID=A0A2P1NMB4_9BURK|nr:GNAT family N-acetyltransferase [Pulveribacter suum]AVP58208.1 N-acetyltransferase [Pulveribacter suum]
MQVEYSHTLSSHERAHIISQVILHDRAAVGATTPKLIDFGARIEGTLVGGVCGRIELRRLFVEYLWVESRYRGNGIGTQLLKAVEYAASARGCRECQIESLSVATAHIYIARGYRVMYRLPDYIPGLSLIVLVKQL